MPLEPWKACTRLPFLQRMPCVELGGDIALPILASGSRWSCSCKPITLVWAIRRTLGVRKSSIRILDAGWVVWWICSDLVGVRFWLCRRESSSRILGTESWCVLEELRRWLPQVRELRSDLTGKFAVRLMRVWRLSLADLNCDQDRSLSGNNNGFFSTVVW